MSQGRKVVCQQTLFVETTRVLGHIPRDPFYTRLAKVLDLEFVRELSKPLYTEKMGRPSLDPVVFVKCLLFGFFEGIAEDQQLELRLAESITARRYLGYSLEERTPDESTIRKTRQRMPEEFFVAVFDYVLRKCAQHGLLKGRALGHDSTTVEANASKQKLLHRELGCRYEDYMRQVRAQDRPAISKDDAVAADRKTHLPLSNSEWYSPTDPDARVAKMKDGHTDLAYKINSTVDLETGLIVSASANTADVSDQHDLLDCVDDAVEKLEMVGLSPTVVVADKGYHSAENLVGLAERGLVSLVGAPRVREAPEGFRHGDFTYDAETETLVCPAGEPLRRFRSRTPDEPDDGRLYRARGQTCRACPHFGHCTKSKSGRTVLLSHGDEEMRANASRVRDPLLRPLICARHYRGEPPFGYLKGPGGMRRLMGRGLDYAHKKALIAAIGWDLLLLLNHLGRKAATIAQFGLLRAYRRLLTDPVALLAAICGVPTRQRHFRGA